MCTDSLLPGPSVVVDLPLELLPLPVRELILRLDLHLHIVLLLISRVLLSVAVRMAVRLCSLGLAESTEEDMKSSGKENVSSRAGPGG